MTSEILKPTVVASYEMEGNSVIIEVVRSSSVENTTEEKSFFFWSAVHFLECLASELNRFANLSCFVRLHVRKTLHGCVVKISQFSGRSDHNTRDKEYEIIDFNSLALMQHDMVTFKTDVIETYFMELGKPTLAEMFQTDTLAMSE